MRELACIKGGKGTHRKTPSRRGRLLVLTQSGYVFASSVRLLADLSADSILLLVQRFLLLFGDVPAVLRRHATLFLANLPVFLVELRSLAFGYLAFLHFLLNALILV